MNSVVSYPDRGNGGRSSYRGNCSPLLIEDLIQQYQLPYLSDYMVGSGTTEDVCRAKGIPGTFLDLNRGFDLIEMDIPDVPRNIFWHPPYGSMIIYSGEQYSAEKVIQQYGIDPRKNDLSRCKDWAEFVDMMNYCMFKQFAALEKGGRMFILMGDMKKKGKLYSMLCDIAKPGTLEQIIIKMQHNCVSSRTQYSGRFVPIVHEYLMVVRKDAALMFPVSLPRRYDADLRDINCGTWKDVLVACMSDHGPMHLEDIYRMVDGHKKAQKNPHWRDKIRQTLQMHQCFRSSDRGVWAYTAA
ncbi:MAG: hypothetical protein II038_06360 [Lachnospiraceae bacterium]|nr:hypothetical protein [Lachnospiraceae bacterium]